jgi:hypothetical protein
VLHYEHVYCVYITLESAVVVVVVVVVVMTTIGKVFPVHAIKTGVEV